MLAARWWRMELNLGDIVIVDHPSLSIIVKRICAFKGNGDMLLKGDSRHSASPIDIGWVHQESVKAKVIWNC